MFVPRALVLLCLAQAILAGTPSRSLKNANEPIKIAFFDFDKTLAVNSYGEVVLRICQEECSCPCSEPEQLTKALGTMDMSNTTEAFGVQARIDRMAEFFQELQDKGVAIYTMSTSWEEVSAKDWASFLSATLERVKLGRFFPKDQVLTLADPGPGIAADKAGLIEETLKKLGLRPEQSLFYDDSEGNIKSAVGKSDTVFIHERKGMDSNDMEYGEARAAKGAACDQRPRSLPRAPFAPVGFGSSVSFGPSFGSSVFAHGAPLPAARPLLSGAPLLGAMLHRPLAMPHRPLGAMPAVRLPYRG